VKIVACVVIKGIKGKDFRRKLQAGHKINKFKKTTINQTVLFDWTLKKLASLKIDEKERERERERERRRGLKRMVMI